MDSEQRAACELASRRLAYPAAWGIMLADLAKHIVNSHAQDMALDRLKTLQRIKAAFDAELAKPTDDPTGR